jgi:hypothetical protein
VQRKAPADQQNKTQVTVVRKTAGLSHAMDATGNKTTNYHPFSTGIAADNTQGVLQFRFALFFPSLSPSSPRQLQSAF